MGEREYCLWIDKSKDSQRAIELIKRKNIEFKVIDSPTDEEWELPCLLIPEGRCEGLQAINSYMETAYPN